jgi:DNA-binding NarL/FixJ family response regulator
MDRQSDTILVADADDASRSEIARLLRSVGYRAREAATGDDVLEAVRDERPALVISEVELPGVCGYEVCRRLRDRYGSTVSIIFVSGTRNESFDHVAGIQLGADDYLDKPIAGDELLARVDRLLRRPAPTRAAADLTDREREVFSLLEAGLRHKEIAEYLSISPKTVGTHVEHIFSKLGATHRLQALALGRGAQLTGTAS